MFFIPTFTIDLKYTHLAINTFRTTIKDLPRVTIAMAD